MVTSSLIERNTKYKLLRMSIFFLHLSFLITMICLNSLGAIQIGSIEDLQKIGNDPGYPLNGEYELTQEIDASATKNWNNGTGFKPIGSATNPFTGKLNGKEKKIINLYINFQGGSNIGLFSVVSSGGQVSNCKLENIQVSGDSGVGGLVGQNYGTLTNNYLIGTISGTGIYVGGMVGENYGSLVRCNSICRVYGGYYGVAGALVGLNSQGTISKCYSYGYVSGSGVIGGLVGWNWKGTISQSYSTAATSGENVIGGLSGENYQGRIWQTYATGRIETRGEIVGGLLGWNTGEVSQSYWDMETTGKTTSAGGIGKSSSEMKRKSTYQGWDFNNVWDIQEGATYPWLRAEPNPPPEGDPNEAEGDTEEEETCGCSSKHKDRSLFWKNIFDLVFIGMLITVMSGMKTRRH
ncbi:MAG: hypothetical protein N3G21_09555 [Candidatus Hydrogenedentes bacterium]|nr:hypothetical protein [Candidatus Hydrogenedentota bacterium]